MIEIYIRLAENMYCIFSTLSKTFISKIMNKEELLENLKMRYGKTKVDEYLKRLELKGNNDNFSHDNKPYIYLWKINKILRGDGRKLINQKDDDEAVEYCENPNMEEIINSI